MKAGRYQLSKVKEPYGEDVFTKGSQLRSVGNTITKNFQFRYLASGIMNTASTAIVKGSHTAQASKDSKNHEKNGTENGIILAVNAAHGLPTNVPDDDDEDFI